MRKTFTEDYLKELKTQIRGKKIVDVGFFDDGVYLKLDDETIIECGSSSSCGIITVKDKLGNG